MLRLSTFLISVFLSFSVFSSPVLSGPIILLRHINYEGCALGELPRSVGSNCLNNSGFYTFSSSATATTILNTGAVCGTGLEPCADARFSGESNPYFEISPHVFSEGDEANIAAEFTIMPGMDFGCDVNGTKSQYCTDPPNTNIKFMRISAGPNRGFKSMILSGSPGPNAQLRLSCEHCCGNGQASCSNPTVERKISEVGTWITSTGGPNTYCMELKVKFHRTDGFIKVRRDGVEVAPLDFQNLNTIRAGIATTDTAHLLWSNWNGGSPPENANIHTGVGRVILSNGPGWTGCGDPEATPDTTPPSPPERLR